MGDYKILGITGNRPEKIISMSQEDIYIRLNKIIERFKNSGGEIVVQGGARGVDLWCGFSALKNGLEVWSYLPHEGEAAKWSTKDKQLHKLVVGNSSKVTYAGDNFKKQNYFIRNQKIIDDCDILLATHDENIEDGGAIWTMNKAIEIEKPTIENIIGKPSRIINYNLD